MRRGRLRHAPRSVEAVSPAWRFLRWWDDAVALAIAESARTGRRHVVRASRLFPGYWLVTEAGA